MPDVELRRQASPPLRVYHLLLLMTCMAVVACWRQALNEKIAEVPRRYRSSNTPADLFRISLAQTLGYGGMLAVTIAGLNWKLRRRGVRWEAGQWLALLGSVGFVHEVAFSLDRFVPWFGPPENGPPYTLPVRREFAYDLACAAVIGCVAMRRDYGWVWRAALAVLSVQLLMYSLCNGMFLFASWFDWSKATFDRLMWPTVDAAGYSRVAALVAVAMAFLVNVACRRGMTWAHWAGAGFWLALGWSFEAIGYLQRR